MRIPSAKIESATAQDERRPQLRNVYLDVEKETLRAADGWILARVPAYIDVGDISGPIPVEALEYTRTHRVPIITAEEDDVVVGSVRFGKPEGLDGDTTERFNKIENIAEETIENHHIKIGLSISLLHRLAEAICDGSRLDLALYITDDPEAPIAVRSLENEANIGLIMPMHIGDTRRRNGNIK